MSADLLFKHSTLIDGIAKKKDVDSLAKSSLAWFATKDCTRQMIFKEGFRLARTTQHDEFLLVKVGAFRFIYPGSESDVMAMMSKI